VGYAWQVVWSLKDFVAIKQAFGSAFPVSYPSHLVAAATGLTGSRFVFRSVTHRPIMYDPSGSLSRALSFVPRRAAAEPYRFLSNALLHGDLFHLYFNLSFLRSVIPSLQSLQTPTDLLYSAFLISVIAGNVACFFTYGARSLTPCVGASGGIFGLLGLLLVASRRARATNLSQNVMRTAALNFAYGLMSPGISNAAHAGGFAAGIAVGYLGGGKMKKGYQSKRSPYVRASERWEQAAGNVSLSNPSLLRAQVRWRCLSGERPRQGGSGAAARGGRERGAAAAPACIIIMQVF
jgi:membrane associated rhomboid family serine protease